MEQILPAGKRVGKAIELWVRNLMAKDREAIIAGWLLLSDSELFRLSPEPHAVTNSSYDPGGLGRGALNIAIIGDSLSQEFFLASAKQMLRQMRIKRITGNWASDNSPRGIESLYRRLSRDYPVRVSNYARACACVPFNCATTELRKEICLVEDMPEQVDRVLKEKDFPNLILVWIGHNNIQWRGKPLNQKTLDPYSHSQMISDGVVQVYLQQIQRLIASAKRKTYRHAIIVYGLGNVESVLALRAQALKWRKKHPGSYPYFEKSMTSCSALHPGYQDWTIAIRDQINLKLKREISLLYESLEVADKTNIHISYSDALAKVILSDLNLLHPSDAWHLSPMGHETMAFAAEQSVRHRIEFLIGKRME